MAQMKINSTPRKDASDCYYNWRLREARARRRLSLKELAEKSGVNFVTIGAYERFYCYPSQENAEKIARALRKPIIYLFPEEFRALTHEVIIERGYAKTKPNEGNLGISLYVGDDDRITLLPESSCFKIEDKDETRERINGTLTKFLTPSQYRVLMLRYGLFDGKERNGIEIAKILGCNKQNVYDLLKRGLKNLRGLEHRAVLEEMFL